MYVARRLDRLTTAELLVDQVRENRLSLTHCSSKYGESAIQVQVVLHGEIALWSLRLWL